MITACSHNQLEVVQLLLDSGADINLSDKVCNCIHCFFLSLLIFFSQNHWTPLHCASKEGHLTVVEHLMKCGAQLDIKNHVGHSVKCQYIIIYNNRETLSIEHDILFPNNIHSSLAAAVYVSLFHYNGHALVWRFFYTCHMLSNLIQLYRIL